MKSVVLDTIKDIGLILHAFDLGGCTKDAPTDEYMHEAAEIFTLGVSKLRDLTTIDSKACFLHDVIDNVFRRSFGDFLYRAPQAEVRQVATAIVQAWYTNIEFHSGKKATSE